MPQQQPQQQYDFDFPVQYVNNLTDIPEQIVRLVDPDRRTNPLVNEDGGAIIVFVYLGDNVPDDERVKLFDRIKHPQSYLQATQHNLPYDRREIEQVYVIDGNAQ